MGAAIRPSDLLYARLTQFERRVSRALNLIEQAARLGAICISFSGGKDSTVLLDLVRGICPDAPIGWFDSGAELSSTREIVRHYQATVIRPEMSLPEMCRYGGYWGYGNPIDAGAEFDFLRILVTDPAERFLEHYRGAVSAIGLRAQESRGREMSAFTHGELHRMPSGIWRLCPLMFWTVDDIWAYIASRELPYNSAYDRLAELGVERSQQRISTVLGASAATTGRYAYLKQLDPELWNQLAVEFPKIRAYA